MNYRYSLQADYFSKGIETGLIDWQEARRWADSIIETTDNPDFKFIEVSLCLSSSEIISALHTFPGAGETNVIAYGLYAKLSEANFNDVDSLTWGIRKAMQVSRHCGLSDSIYYEFDGLGDYLFLARHGEYGSVEECKSDFLTLLEKLAQPLILD